MKSLLDHTLDCVHCGLCLPSCPTHDLLRLEPDSPRGRIHLVRASLEGRVVDAAAVQHHLDRCLGCRACETSCPSGVRYGELLEAARAHLPRRVPRLRRFLLSRIVARPRRLHTMFSLLATAERLGLRRLGEWLRLVPTTTRDLVPAIPKRRERRLLTGIFEPHTGERRGTVALFSGCLMQQVFGALNRQTLELLRQQGFRVLVPADQTCCGALHRHDGDEATAARLAEQNERAFGSLQVDAIIHNSAGCGAAMKEGLGTCGERARDVCEFLAQVGLLEPPQSLRQPTRAVYDAPCHLHHAQRVTSQPLELLRQVPNLELLPNSDSENCCGSAGIYNLTQPDLAAAIGKTKAERLLADQPDMVITGNPGCILQIRSHLRRLGSAAEVVHPVELLVRRHDD